VRRWLVSLVLAVICGCTAPNPIVPREPPMPKEERRPLKPGSEVFWQSGHWAWDPEVRHYYWSAGGWAKERQDRFWIPGYWDPVTEGDEKGWRWVDERWAHKEELDQLPPD
jgi:hypothetical protein